jgi:hypothetical protein
MRFVREFVAMLDVGRLIVLSAVFTVGACGAQAAPAAPSGPHPRLYLDSQTLAAWRSAASTNGTAVKRAIDACKEIQANPAVHAGSGYAGFDFVGSLVSCLIQFKATGSAGAKAQAFRFFNALLDDWNAVGDGMGGDTVVRHDTGYLMRTFGAYAGLAYDWLHDEPEMTEALRMKALGRFKAWTDWYRTMGYMNDTPGANYHAGWVYAGTMIAIAQAGDADTDTDGDALWSYIADRMWGTDMAHAFTSAGVLHDGEWLEGWQYGVMSVAEYALSARALNDSGVPTPGIAPWLAQVVLREHYSLLPGRNVHFIVGDNDEKTPYATLPKIGLTGIIAGPASSTTKAQARGILQRFGIQYDADLYGALAEAISGPAEAMPPTLPTMYLANVAGNVYVRSGWDSRASYSVFQCGPHIVPEHTGDKATSFVLSRGADDLVMDSQPYGAETLASNGVAIDFGRPPGEYSPFQSYWNAATKLNWAVQTTSGVTVARCDFQDAFRITWEATSTVQAAVRDFVFVPHAGNVSVVLIDRMRVENTVHQAHLRYRSPGSFTPKGNQYVSTVGASQLFAQVFATVSPVVDALVYKDYCDRHDASCQLTGSRVVPGSQLRVDVAGSPKTIVSVLDGVAANQTPPQAVSLSGSGYVGVTLLRDNQSFVVIAADQVLPSPPPSLSYDVEGGGGALNVVLDAPANSAGFSNVTAVASGMGCRVTVAPAGGSGGFAGRPLLFNLSPSCTPGSESTQSPVNASSADTVAPQPPANLAVL